MAVHIRLARAGTKKRPFYRVVVTDQRSPRGGRFLENIGTFDPATETAQIQVNDERLTYWRSVGAQPSATVDRLLRRRPAPAAAAPAPAAAAPAKATKKK
ncbi:MAG: 30S ribosomal protein S16 [Polyangiaceae bacterium]